MLCSHQHKDGQTWKPTLWDWKERKESCSSSVKHKTFGNTRKQQCCLWFDMFFYCLCVFLKFSILPFYFLNTWLILNFLDVKFVFVWLYRSLRVFSFGFLNCFTCITSTKQARTIIDTDSKFTFKLIGSKIRTTLFQSEIDLKLESKVHSHMFQKLACQISRVEHGFDIFNVSSLNCQKIRLMIEAINLKVTRCW